MTISVILVILLASGCCSVANIRNKRPEVAPGWMTVVDGLSQKVTELTSRVAANENQLSTIRKSVAAFYVQHAVDPFNVTGQGKVIYDVVKINLGSGYDVLSGVFRAPYAGTYLFFLSCLAVFQKTEEAYIMADGKIVGGCYAESIQATGLGSNSVIVQLSKGAAVWVQILGNGENVRGWLWNSFGGFLLRAKT